LASFEFFGLEIGHLEKMRKWNLCYNNVSWRSDCDWFQPVNWMFSEFSREQTKKEKKASYCTITYSLATWHLWCNRKCQTKLEGKSLLACIFYFTLWDVFHNI